MLIQVNFHVPGTPEIRVPFVGPGPPRFFQYFQETLSL